MPSERKTCTKCKRRKALSSFAKDKTKPGGVRSQCRDCIQEMRKTRKAQIAAEKAKPTPQQEIIRQASRRAVEELVRNHRGEFDHLMRKHRILLGDPTVRPKKLWTNLTNEHAYAEI